MNHKILHHLTTPGESAEYRVARNKLLTEEMALRRQIDSVAALRRALRVGGAVVQDYLFEGDDGPLKLSDLFKPGIDTLAIYRFMYGPERELPCTGCTHFLDGLEGMVQHITQRINLAVVAKSLLPRLWLWLVRVAGAPCPCCLPTATITTETISATHRGCLRQRASSKTSKLDKSGTYRCSVCSSGTAR
jgi:predicted dithiol-disulfide oxidoreductase (DUF899 family)